MAEWHEVIERAVCPLLVGRSAELSALEDALVDASLGEGSIFLLLADAGLGKTRLANELRKRSQRIGCTALWGDCRENELALPYLPVVEALTRHLTPSLVLEVQQRLGLAARELAPLVPEFGPQVALTESGDPGQSRLRLYEAVLALLRVLTSERPLLMVLEDIHWSDAATRGLLDFLARRLSELPVLLLATIRSDDLYRGHPVSALLQGWRRGHLAHAVELSSLGAEGVSDMVTAALDAPEISAEFRDYVHARSEGNPFVVEELLKEAIDRHDVYRSDSGWHSKAIAELSLPRAVSETILLRVERLGPADLAVLQAAAVLGRTFAYMTLVSVTGLSAPAIQTVLETCVRQQLLVEDDQMPGRFRFRHALTREAIYDDMILPRRQALHLNAAAVIRDSGGGLAEIAEHLLEGGDVAEAVPSCLQAGEDATARNAPDVAAKLFERALPFISDPIERGRLLMRIGEAIWRSGDVKRARKFLTEAMAPFQRDGDAITVAHIHVLLGHCEHRLPSPKHYLAARDLLEGLGPSEDLAAVYLRLAIIRANAMDGRSAIEFADRAVHTAQDVGARSYCLWASGAMGAALATLGRVDEALELMERSCSEALERGWYWIARAVRRNILALLCEDLRKPELPEAIRRWRALPGHSDEHEGLAQIFEAEMEAATGNITQLQRGAASAARLVRDFDYQIWQLQLLHFIEADRLDEAGAVAASLHRTDAHSELEVGQRQTFVTALALARGSAGAAVEAASWALTTEATNVWAWMSDMAVSAFLAADRIAEARTILESPNHFSGPGREPFLTRARGRVALAEGRAAEAVQHLAEARQDFSRRGERRQELFTMLALAEAGAACAELETAREHLEEVIGAADPAGLALIARLARQEATVIGVRLAGARRSGDGSPEQTAAPQTVVGRGPAAALVGRVLIDGPSRDAPEVDAYLRWAERYLATHRADAVALSGAGVRAHFDPSRHGEPSPLAPAVRAALGLRAKASLAGVPLGMSLAARASAGEAFDAAVRLSEDASPGDLLLDQVTRVAVAGWLAEHSAARTHLDVEGEVHLTGARTGSWSDPGSETVAATTEPSLEAVGNAFIREGEFWSLTFEGTVVRLRDAKGLRDIARLLADAGREVAAVDLASRDQRPTRSLATVAALGLGVEADAGDVLDAEARAQYRTRLADLEEEVVEADTSNDPERASRARQEREFLLAELGAAVGLTGKPRRALDPAERARKAVTGRIRDAVSNIEAAHPALGRHMRRSLRTGSFCAYDPPEAVTWRL